MDAKDLIGQFAIRTEPVDLGNGNKDYSYCSGHGVRILSADGNNVIIQSNYTSQPYALDKRFVKNWKPMYGTANKGEVQ